MGQKYCSLTAGLAFIGAAVAGFLTYSYYFPGADAKFVVCGGEYAGNCDALNQWGYASIFGMPLAVYGLFMFLLILFTVVLKLLCKVQLPDNRQMTPTSCRHPLGRQLFCC